MKPSHLIGSTPRQLDFVRYCLLLFVRFITPGVTDSSGGVDYTVISPRRPRLSSDTHQVVDPPFNTKLLVKPLFIARVICSRISRTAKALGRSVRLGADPGFTDLAAVYYRYMDACLHMTNERIRHEPPGSHGITGFSCIRDLCYMDLYVPGSLWQAHMRGFLANIHRMGGITAMSKWPEPPYFLIHTMLL